MDFEDDERDNPLPPLDQQVSQESLPSRSSFHNLSEQEFHHTQYDRDQDRGLASPLSFSSEVDEHDRDLPPKDLYTTLSEKFEQTFSKIEFIRALYEKSNEPPKPLEPPVDPQLERQHHIELDKIPKALFRSKEIISWFFYDIATTPYPNSVLVAFLAPYMAITAQQAAILDRQVIHSQDIYSSLTVSPFGFRISTESLYSYCLSLSIILQFLCYVAFGSFADYGYMRKRLLILTSLLGSLTVACFFVVTPGYDYWIAAVLLVISNIFWGMSLVYYNSFIPYLIKSHPSYKDLNDPSLKNVTITERQFLLRKNEVISSSISLYGSMLGFVAGVVLIVINIIVFFVFPESCRPLCQACPRICSLEHCPSNWNPKKCDPDHKAFRINLAIIGIWWLFFSIICFLFLKNRKGLDLPPGPKAITVGVANYIQNFHLVKQLPETFRFIIAFWIYGDGMATLAYGTWFIASHSLAVSGSILGIAFLASMIFSLLGNYFFLYLSQKYSFWKPKRIIVVCVSISCIIPIWAFVMSSWYEFMSAAVLFGFLNAPLQGFSRALLATLIPTGKEAQFYSIYGLTDRSSSWLGALIVAVITDITEDFRIAVVAIVILLGVGLGVLISVNTEHGTRDAKLFSESVESLTHTVTTTNLTKETEMQEMGTA